MDRRSSVPGSSEMVSNLFYLELRYGSRMLQVRLSHQLRSDFLSLIYHQVSSLLQSEQSDHEGRAILQKHIHLLRSSGKSLELNSLLNRLRGEVGNLDSKVASTNDCIKDLQESIADLQEKAKRLDDQRNKIQQLHDRVESSSSRSLSVIPPEILGEIFIACLPQHPRPINTEVPLLLCQICSTWRQIALNTPQLWAFVTVTRTKDVRHIPQVADKWFKLAGMLPLSLRFDMGHQSEFLYTQCVPLPLSDAWSRISNLEINAAYSSPIQKILRFTRPLFDFSNIERVEVSTDFPSYTELMNFPNLRKLIVSYKHSLPQRTDLMPFTNLTHLCISGGCLSAQMWSLVIRQCLKLQHGSFLISTTMQFPHVAGKETTLEHLLTLKLVLQTLGYPRMMDNLHFPSLHSLSIGCVEQLSAWNSACLSPITLAKLRSLVLYRLKISIKDLLDILRSTTSLDSLVVDLPIRTSALFKEIIIKQQSSNFIMPMLSRLVAFHSRSIGKNINVFDLVDLVGMVRSRWHVDNPPSVDRRRLSTVSIRTQVYDPNVKRARKLLSGFVQEGLHLDIGVSPNGLRVSTDVDW